MLFTVDHGLLSFVPPPRVSSTKETPAQRASHRAYLDGLVQAAFDLAAERHMAGTLMDPDARELKRLQTATSGRRIAYVRDESLLVRDVRALIKNLTGAIAVSGTPLSLVVRRATDGAPTLTHTSVMTLADARALTRQAVAMRGGQLTAEEWRAAATQTALHSPLPLTNGSLAMLPEKALSPRLRDQLAYNSLRQKDLTVDPRTVMRMVMKRKLTQTDYKRIKAWEAVSGVTQQAIGQRNAYVLVPMLRALLLFLAGRFRGATARALLDVLQRELRKLQVTAEEVGAPFEIDSRDDERPSVAVPTLDFDAVDTGCRPTVRLPTVRTVQRFLKSLPARLKETNASGLDAVRRNSRPTDAIWVASRPNECWQFDNTELDIMISDDRLGQIGGPNLKPWITVVIDEYSRRILSYHLWYTAPNATGIAYALYNAIQPAPRLERYNGCIPDTIRVDRGKEYVSDKMTTVIAALGISLETCRPHRPDDKAVIERVFGSVMTAMSAQPGFTKAHGAHNGTLSKVERGGVLTFHELVVWVEDEIKRHNRTVHSTTRERPVDRWTHETGWEVPEEDDLAFRLLWSNETRTIRKDGIEFNNHFYKGNLKDAQGRTGMELIGLKVRLYFTPGYLDAITVCVANEAGASALRPEVVLGVVYPEENGVARVDLFEQCYQPLRGLQEMVGDFKQRADPATRIATLPPSPMPALAPPALPLALTSGAAQPLVGVHLTAPLTATVQNADEDDLEAGYIARARARDGFQ